MIPLTRDQLQAVIDGAFQFAEGRLEKRPIIRAALEEVQHVFDGPGVAALYAFLKSKGVVA